MKACFLNNETAAGDLEVSRRHVRDGAGATRGWREVFRGCSLCGLRGRSLREARRQPMLRCIRAGIYFMKTVLPSYVPPPCALPLEGRVRFKRARSAAMLRGAVC